MPTPDVNNALLDHLLLRALVEVRTRLSAHVMSQAEIADALLDGRLVVVVDFDGGYLMPAAALTRTDRDVGPARYAGRVALGSHAAPEPSGVDGGPASGPPCGTTSGDDCARRPE